MLDYKTIYTYVKYFTNGIISINCIFRYHLVCFTVRIIYGELQVYKL